ncbi:spinocerebellar ataxia type 10 protein domain-containing protein [Powellomyces hirtus]|nr:spinocerebellar ataxia type 10 protein domain-containing protein [Powellomyces hirtus]
MPTVADAHSGHQPGPLQQQPPPPPPPPSQTSQPTTSCSSFQQQQREAFAHYDLKHMPDAAARLLTAWEPLLERMNAGCSAPPAYEHLAEATSVVDQIAKELAKKIDLRIAVGQSPHIFPSLRNAFIFSRNHLFCVFGVGRQGVACPTRAERAVDLAAAHFMFVRNLSAQVRTNQYSAWEQGLYEPAEEIMSYLCSWLATTKDCCSVMRDKVAKCVSMGTQMLANMMTANPDVQDKLWPRYFQDSELLGQLLATCDINRVTYVLICIYNCTLKCRERCKYMTDTRIGRDLLKGMLDKTAKMLCEDECSAFDYVYAIFSNLIELDMTPDIMCAMCYGRDEQRPHLLFQHHITFLQLLDGMVSAQRGGPPLELSIDTALFLVCVTKKLVRLVRKGADLTETRSKPAESAQLQPKPLEQLNFGLDVEGLVLVAQFLGRITQEMGPDAKLKLMHAGLGDALLDLLDFLTIIQPRSTLKTLPPVSKQATATSTSSPSPEPHRQAAPLPIPAEASTCNPPTTSPSSPATVPASEQQPPLPQQPTQQQKQSPFFMLKTDTIRIIANLSYEATEVQDAFRNIGGVHAVLNHCAIDDDNPYIKEHSILALHNLLDSNPQNQDLVAQLRPQGIDRETNAMLHTMGKSASVSSTGKVRIAPLLPEEQQQPSKQPYIAEIATEDAESGQAAPAVADAERDTRLRTQLGIEDLQSKISFMEVDM